MICHYCYKSISFWDMWNTVICKPCHWDRCVEDRPTWYKKKELEK